MSQRNSGYKRKKHDCYETPEWVTRALMPHLPLESHPMKIWEPASGRGKMEFVLRNMGHHVRASDIANGDDFLKEKTNWGMEAIITNPPFGLAQEFIEHALRLTPIVAMLLRADYDHAKTRKHLFGDCPQFSKKLALTKRIVWFERPGAAPSFNHAWFIWDWKHKGPPTLTYGP